MELYLVIVIVLFFLAISDLMVGVANDAVNFLNSAVGSKAAPFKVIMTVASLGIIIGVTFSSGLMEIARKGIFNPEMFLFTEVMVIFLAVMLTDVLLLDLFNTFGLPTSTTVSLIFELIGAAVAVSIIKISSQGEPLSVLFEYINTAKALAIISGILISVVVAFTSGAIVQFFTRLIFTFDFQRKIRRYGGLWGGFVLTFITYFILVKGAKGAIFLSAENIEWILNNTDKILLYSFIIWGVIIQFFVMFTKVNVLKPIVLAGTFALALAFAANDLVNFIGVPLAGFSSYIIASVSNEPFNLSMGALKEPVHTNSLFLIIAGLIMMLTLWFSKKARTVTKTEVNLGRQFDGFERFESSILSRSIVRMVISIFEFFKSFTPAPIQKIIQRRLDKTAFQPEKDKDNNLPAFDLLRATVNLMVASVLISFATSLKLPLSTTYVTFMVAMGTSLADRSWGRESAVYRVNGVLTVIGGWFFTAFMAFTIAATFATIIYFGHLTAIILLVILAIFIVFKTHFFHKAREKESEELEKVNIDDKMVSSEVVKTNVDFITQYLDSVSQNIACSLEGLYEEDRKILKRCIKEGKKITKHSNMIVSNIFKEVKMLKDDEIKEERKYGKIVASLREVATNLKNLNQRCHDHIENNHSKPNKEQIEDLKFFNKLISSQIKESITYLSSAKSDGFKKVEDIMSEIKKSSVKLDKNQVQRIKKNTSSVKNSLLFMEVVSDTENISNQIFTLTTSLKTNLEAVAPKEKKIQNKTGE
jgi:phosphate/sulfate permease